MKYAKVPPLAVFDLRPLQCAYASRGIGRYTRELLRALRASMEENPRYRIEGLDFGGETPEDLPIAIRAPKWDRIWLWDQTVLPWRLWRSGARIFHSCAALGPLKEVNFPVPFAGRSVLTVHDWNMFAKDATPLERFYRSTRRIRFQKFFIGRAARVVVDADSVAEETRALGKVSAAKISVIPPGGDHLDAVAEILPRAKGFVLSIGDGPHKGLDTAFAATREARARGLNRDWVIAGEPVRVKSVLGMSVEMPSWIRILPSPTDAELKGLYRAALCLLFPSRREGFGFPALEAMRLGCPVLASNVEPVRSMIGIRECLIPADDIGGFSDALLRLAAGNDFRAGVAERGMERARDYTWKRVSDQVLALWDRAAPITFGGDGPSGGTGRR